METNLNTKWVVAFEMNGKAHEDECRDEAHAQQYAHEIRETLIHGFGEESPSVRVIMVINRPA